MKQSLLILAFCLAWVGGASFASGEEGTWPKLQSIALLGEPSPALLSFLAQSRAQHSSEAFVGQVLGEARQLRSRGLPPEPYLLKASEGLAKGVPPARLNSALEKTQRQTEWAGRLVDRAIVKGAKVDSPQERLRTIQGFQQAMLSEVPPDLLNRMVEAPNPSETKGQSLRELSGKVRSLAKEKPALAPGQQPSGKTRGSSVFHESKEEKQKGKAKGEKATASGSNSGKKKAPALSSKNQPHKNAVQKKPSTQKSDTKAKGAAREKGKGK